jgi:hypothetical protein
MAQLGYDNDSHLERIEELLEQAQHDLSAVGDADECQGRFDALLRARGSLSEAAGHVESLEGFLDKQVDEDLSRRYQSLNDHYMKLRDNVGRLCLRRD